MKGWLRKLLLSAGICLIALIVLEVLLLLFNDYVFRSSFYIFDSDLGFRVRPYATFGNDRANEFGFNDSDYSHSRRPDTYRILFLGDSFNWMGGIEKNYVSLVEKLLEKEFGSGRVEVINAGYSQTHTGEQLALLKKFGLLYNPDLVILSVFAGNDFYDADPQRKRIAIGGGMTDVFTDRDFYAVVLGKPVVLKSRLVLYLQERWRSLESRSQETANAAGKGSKAPVDGNRPQHLQRGAQPVNNYYLNSLYLRTQFNRLDRFGDFEPNVALICESILAMETLLSEQCVDFAVAVFPDEIQVDPEVKRAFLEHYQIASEQFEWDRAQLILRQLCADRGIAFFDLYPVFLEATRSGQQHYLPNNGHWNDAGNELAARFFFTSLNAQVRLGLGF